ncbi:MAG: C25 family cysteine peptidase [Phycisphaerae bacterium]
MLYDGNAASMEALEPRLMLSADAFSWLAENLPATASTNADINGNFNWSGWQKKDNSSSASFNFSVEGTPTIETSAHGEQVLMEGLELWQNELQPMLPVLSKNVLLPQGTEIESVTIEFGDGRNIGKGIKLLSTPEAAREGEGGEYQVIYADSFDQDDAAVWNTQFYRGHSIGVLNLFPVLYDSFSGDLSFYNDMTVSVEVTEATGRTLTVQNSSEDVQAVAEMVENDSELLSYDYSLQPTGSNQLPWSGSFDYMIITNDALSGSFQTLLDHKAAKGLSTTMVTTEYIFSNYSGTENGDQADQIRHFIQDAYANWGVEYVLLGGDVSVIPERGLYGSSGSYTQNYIPGDIYYAALDGTWNGDGDSLWGESNDGTNGGDVDLVPDVKIGRAPVETIQETNNFVNKTITYEITPRDNVNSFLSAGEKLDSTTYGSYSIEQIADNIVPDSWTVDKLYDIDGTWSRDEMIAKLNDSPHLVDHLGHGMTNYVGKTYSSNVDSLTNDLPYFMYSQACDAGAFDRSDSVAEHHVKGEHGAFAVVMNSRYGWYYPGSYPGGNHHWDVQFWDAIFNEGITDLGGANNDSKMDNLYRVGTSGSNRWIHFELNLLGDPETSIHMENPEAPEPPEAPSLAVNSTGGREITLDWTGTAGDVIVERKSADGTYQQIATTSGTSYVDNNVDPQTEYVYRVRSSVVGSPTSNEMQVRTWLYGDTNGDGVVDPTDRSVLSSHYGQTGTWAEGDFDGSGSVNLLDFSWMSLNYGNSASYAGVDVTPAAAEEPTLAVSDDSTQSETDPTEYAPETVADAATEDTTFDEETEVEQTLVAEAAGRDLAHATGAERVEMVQAEANFRSPLAQTQNVEETLRSVAHVVESSEAAETDSVFDTDLTPIALISV